jgi:hypothetical protein
MGMEIEWKQYKPVTKQTRQGPIRPRGGLADKRLESRLKATHFVIFLASPSAGPKAGRRRCIPVMANFGVA